ncbi:GspE/PulE family protein [Alkalicoccus daliensis]|uniref:Type IV pilus assembly protein PilB n=1 Tax=Alkalicoccus daliensis TaxID=745820 RepID=A0A1H0CLV7_9BACI|nr:ATPase, T2SS/T4P/T4SS family [Alkalicoccus daliensis]SDN58822.1 type IV pilus assembly protein PilB [Alkalicoccus daliensis]
MKENRRRLGDILVEANVLTKDQVEETVKNKGNKKLGDALKEAGLISEEQLLEVLEFQLNIPRVKLKSYPIDSQLTKLTALEFAERNSVFPIDKKDGRLIVAMADPMDYFTLDDLRMATGFEIEPVIASYKEIQEAIKTYYGNKQEVSDLEVEDPEELNVNTQIADDETDAPVIRMVNQALVTGLEKKASDIHIDPQETKIVIRYRIDGILFTERAIAKQHHNAMVARVKIMANLNITETRLPQDGRVKVTLQGTRADLRVSSMPTVFGEKIVIRILDMNQAQINLEDLDFNAINQTVFQELIHRPGGMVLITGPTGSGKTTTLYAALNKRNNEEMNVITVEDPVEYQIEGINQVQVNPKIGLTFAHGLRAILRQDPDLVMVGEIRDSETAEIAVRASLTGHLVLSTIHTNSAIATIPRLIDMGVEPYLVMSSLSGIVSQRLVRKICTHCKTSYEPTKTELQALEERGIKAEVLYRGPGCENCNETGYEGRMAIHELLSIDDEVRRLVLNQEAVSVIKAYLLEKDMLFLKDDGFFKVKQGFTTMEEVFRVASDD